MEPELAEADGHHLACWAAFSEETKVDHIHKGADHSTK